MNLDLNLLRTFEASLDPVRPEAADPPAEILGYGEISSIFKIGGDEGTAYKRMPLFQDPGSARDYIRQYATYCGLLREAGLTLPRDATAVVEIENRPVVLYIAQERLPSARFGHNLIRTMDGTDAARLIEDIVREISKIWRFNRAAMPETELALDGQISNWVRLEEGQLLYVDTSTPLFRIGGEIGLDPELFLQSAPSFLRWIIRRLFLNDVMTRYFDARKVYTDLAANLYKEQRPDLIEISLGIINAQLEGGVKPLALEEVSKYYREDKIIWQVFLAFRRFDRWMRRRLLRKRYEFILPGEIER